MCVTCIVQQYVLRAKFFSVELKNPSKWRIVRPSKRLFFLKKKSTIVGNEQDKKGDE
jgi:hypothetical protein